MTLDERLQWSSALVALRQRCQVRLVVEKICLAVDYGVFALNPVSQTGAVLLGRTLQVQQL
jgi:hypothetical protein